MTIYAKGPRKETPTNALSNKSLQPLTRLRNLYLFEQSDLSFPFSFEIPAVVDATDFYRVRVSDVHGSVIRVP